MALILALDRRLIEFNKMVSQNKEWRYDVITDITRFGDQVLGLYGFGNIAREVAKRASAFGIKVIATDPYMNMELAKELNVESVSFEELIRKSDIISIHVPLIKATENSISMKEFKMMEKRPTIVNAGRGGIINEDDLAEALDLGLVRGAALDVLKEENPDLNNSKLVDRDNVILTPHVAYYSQTSQYEIQKRSANNIRLYLEGKFDELSIVNGVKNKIN
jgi:D-3-phosphoglycerate dehydrogenase